MPKRALIQARPYLLFSLVAAILYWIYADENVGGLYLTLLKGVPLALLAAYALVRHHSTDAKMLAGVMALGSLGDMGVEIDWFWGGAAFFLGHAIAIGLYLRHRRPALASSQKVLVVALLLVTPVVSWLLSGSLDVGFYGLALGGMAAAAWASSFTRYRVGIGAVLFVISDLLIFARMGERIDPWLPNLLIWPTYYLGQFLICTGVIQTLRRGGGEAR